MRKRTSGAKLGRQKAHRESLMRNQLRSLFTNGFLVTTTPKAKALKQKAESFLAKIKEDSLEKKRLMYSVLDDASLVEKAMKYSKEKEGKVSVIKFGFRDGDNAEMSKITLLDYAELFGKKKGTRKVAKSKDTKKKGETEFVEEKKDDKVLEKGKFDKSALNIKEKFVSKERAKSRSGI